MGRRRHRRCRAGAGDGLVWAVRRPMLVMLVPGAAARRRVDLAFAAAVLVTLAMQTTTDEALGWLALAEQREDGRRDSDAEHRADGDLGGTVVAELHARPADQRHDRRQDEQSGAEDQHQDDQGTSGHAGV
jgi:hypothetical protein